MTKAQEQLKKIRAEIDKLDHDILKIFKIRFSLVRKIALIKYKNDLPLHQKGRWQSLLNDRLKMARKLGIDDHFIQVLFKIIHKESKRVQKIKIDEVSK